MSTSRSLNLGLQENWEAKMRKMFMCAMGTIGALITTAEMSDLPLKLYLEVRALVLGNTTILLSELASK